MFAKCLKSKCNDNIHYGVSVYLVSISPMPWRRTSVLNPFVKMLNIKYIHICWDMDIYTCLLAVVRLHSLAICKVVFLA